MVPSAPASAAPLSPPVDSERAATEPWDRRVAARDPSVLQAARAGQLEIDQHSYVLNACFKHQAWDWVEQLWPPSQPELNQPAFTDQWVLDAMSAGGPQRAMALYHQADVTKNLGHLLSLAVMRSEPELWETLTSLKEWSDDQGEQAAIQLARWGTDHPRHRTLARTWFLRLAKALPDASRRAHLVRTALLARGMERCAWPIFRSLPPEDQRQAAIEIYPHVESQGLPAWPARCWKALESRSLSPFEDRPQVFSLEFFREWFRTTAASSQHRLLTCLDERELYTAWQAAHVDHQETLALEAWQRVVDRPVPTHPPARFLALSNAMEESDLVWARRWWSPALEKTLSGEQHFQIAILAYSSDNAALKTWAYENLDWDKLESCVRQRDQPCEDFENATLDEALLNAPPAICARWVHQLHATKVELPLAVQRVLAQGRQAAAESAAPARSINRPRRRS